MTTNSLTRSDHDLQTAVLKELEWAPNVDATGIGVSVNSGAVILTGEVRDHAESVAIQQAALRIRGVSAVVDDLKVRPHVSWPASEIEIATAVANALRWASNAPETVQAEVKDHKVTLIGTVRWEFERLAARDAVHYLRGVYAVDNQITLSARHLPLTPERGLGTPYSGMPSWTRTISALTSMATPSPSVER